MNWIRYVNLILFLVFLIACNSGSTDKSSAVNTKQKLPKLGEPSILSKEVNGVLVPDTVYPVIPFFLFQNQEGRWINNDSMKGKIYVADFFFTTCPTICPKMKSQLLRVYEKYKLNSRIKILSHSIDPEHDNVAVLKDYANRLDVSSSTWHFLTGNKDTIYTLAESYLASAAEDPTAPGGFVHSGAFILIDGDGYIRGYYDGTKPEEVDILLNDIDILLNE